MERIAISTPPDAPEGIAATRTRLLRVIEACGPEARLSVWSCEPLTASSEHPAPPSATPREPNVSGEDKTQNVPLAWGRKTLLKAKHLVEWLENAPPSVPLRCSAHTSGHALPWLVIEGFVEGPLEVASVDWSLLHSLLARFASE